MKRITHIVLFAISLVALAVSCHKDPKPDDGQGEQPIDSITRSDTVVFGKTDGMRVTSYDTVINLGEINELDLDNDGHNDLKIESWYQGSQMVGPRQRLYLHCLNENIKLLGEMVERLSYQGVDTTYEVYNSKVHVTCYSVFNTCEAPESENITVIPCDPFVLSANEENNSFCVSDVFETKKIDLFLENIESICTGGYESNDTIYALMEECVYCSNFPKNSEKYVGFKITKEDESFLGWLKLNLQGNSNVKVHLIETAIQE